jgi:ribosomal protein L12E/L44/L45/RPP1/RPP2
MEKKEKHQMLTMQLLFLFQSAALQQMGKLKNPITDKIDRDLAQAQVSIDMVDMLYTRMKATLDSDEERMFTSALQELRLNFVDEVTKEQNAAVTATPPAAAEPAASGNAG